MERFGAGAKILELLGVQRAGCCQCRQLAVADTVEPQLVGRYGRSGETRFIRLQFDAAFLAGGQRNIDFFRLGAERAALDGETVSFDGGAQNFFLEFRFLHQPVGDASQELRLRAAPFETPGPQPHVVTQDLGHPSVADTGQDQQRLLADALH